MVIWEPQGQPRPHGLSYAVSKDGGRQFSQPAEVPGSRGPDGTINGSLQGQLGHKLAVHRTGAVAVSNSLIQQGVQSRVLLIRGQLPGDSHAAVD